MSKYVENNNKINLILLYYAKNRTGCGSTISAMDSSAKLL